MRRATRTEGLTGLGVAALPVLCSLLGAAVLVCHSLGGYGARDSHRKEAVVRKLRTLARDALRLRQEAAALRLRVRQMEAMVLGPCRRPSPIGTTQHGRPAPPRKARQRDRVFDL